MLPILPAPPIGLPAPPIGLPPPVGPLAKTVVEVVIIAMAKAAMSQMTKCLAMEWGPHGVRVNGIGPGFTMTELARPLWENNAEMNQWRVANTPLRRMGLPQDMVGACIFLASDAASFVTGQVLYIDGGTVCGLFWPIPI